MDISICDVSPLTSRTETIVTFAEFCRKRPCVLFSDLDRFLIILNSDGGIRVQGLSTPVEKRLAELILEVLVVEHDGDGLEPTSWSVFVSKDSPSPAHKLKLKDEPSSHLPLTKPKELLSDVANGDVLAFVTPLQRKHKVYRMMLSKWEPGSAGDAGGRGPCNLANTPKSVLKHIISYVPLETVVKRLPFVSSRMFHAAKSMEGTKLDLHGILFQSKEELSSVCAAAKDTCVELVLHNDHRVISSTKIPLHFRWTSLETLTLSPGGYGEMFGTVRRALRKGNLPNLRALSMVSVSCGMLNSELRMEDLDGWQCPKLSSMEINISGFRHFPESVMERFNVLTKLRMVASSAEAHECISAIFKSMEMGHLPHLRDLKLSHGGYLSPAVFPTHGKECSHVHRRLERLSCSCLFEKECDEQQRYVLDGSELLRRFPNLTALETCKCLVIMWNPVLKRGIAQPCALGLLELKITLDRHFLETIRFDYMPNLKSVGVNLATSHTASSRGPGVKSTVDRLVPKMLTEVLSLPHLETLSLGGIELSSIPVGIKPSSSVHVLQLNTPVNINDGLHLDAFSRALKAMPELTEFNFKCCSILAPHTLAGVFGNDAPSVTVFKVAYCPAVCGKSHPECHKRLKITSTRFSPERVTYENSWETFQRSTSQVFSLMRGRWLCEFDELKKTMLAEKLSKRKL